MFCKKLFDKILLDDICFFFCCYLYVNFILECEIGNDVFCVEGLIKIIDGVKVFDNVSFIMNKDDKIVFVGCNEFVNLILMKILMGEMEVDSGMYKWGVIMF